MRKFNNDQEFYDATLTGVESLADNQRDIKAEILRVVGPMAARNQRDKMLERFGQHVRNFGGTNHGGGALSLRSACEIVLEESPNSRSWLRAVVKQLSRAPASSFTEPETAILRALTTGDSGLGQAVSVYEPLATDVYALLLRYAAFRTFGVIPLATGKTKLASVTGKADAYWYQASSQGTAITADASITGGSISPECATVGALVEVSGEALADGKTTFEGALLQAIVEGLGYRLDWSCLQAAGNADTTDGGMTGVFAHASVPVVNAGAGNTNVASLTFDDFANLIGGVTPSALANPCRFWIAPNFIPSVLKIKDGSERLLKPPTGPDDEWRILGYAVTWAAAAPSTDAASSKVAAFGRGDAFSVALRQDFEVVSSAASNKWVQNIWRIRAIARARCLMRDATSLATLKLAAQ